jgi:hypothetical protein
MRREWLKTDIGPTPPRMTNAKERLRELIDRYADAEGFDGDEADGPAGNGFGGPH